MARSSLYSVLYGLISQLRLAEREMVNALPIVAKLAVCNDLREALLAYVGESEHRVQRLESVRSAMMLGSQGLGSAAVQPGLLPELSKDLEQRYGDTDGRDIALIAALRRMEFCNISSYQTARAIAEALGEDELFGILDDNLCEVEAAERFLTVLSEELIDDQGAQESLYGTRVERVPY